MKEYSEYKLELEPKMLSIIEDLVVKIIGVQKTSKDTVIHLIKCGLDEIELHGDLIIKVSSKDLDYVIERKHELTEELSEKIKVEILKDQQLEENECVIETEMGTIDCSLGTQLEGLLKELRLIKNSLLVDALN
jgi:flagellar assembly protein FliH